MKICNIIGLCPIIDILQSGLTGELWTLNDFYNIYRFVADRAFQVHAYYPAYVIRQKQKFILTDWQKYYQKYSKKSYVHKNYCTAENCFTEYDFETVFKLFDKRAFNNSISFILAQAIIEDYQQINFINCPMMVGSEYEKQLPGITYLIEQALNKNIKINAPRHFWKKRKMPDVPEIMYHERKCKRYIDLPPPY